MTAKKESKKQTTAVKKTAIKKTSSAQVVNKATKVASAKVKKAIAEPKVSVKTDDKKSVVVKQKITTSVKKNDSKAVKTKITSSSDVIRATGRRKQSIAKVACAKTTGDIVISVNKMEYKKYFTKLIHQQAVFAPFALLGIKNGYVVNAEVFGGGKTGQSDALKLGLSKCLALLSEEFSAILRKNSYLTRDARQVEPKKYGLKKARKKEQFSKR